MMGRLPPPSNTLNVAAGFASQRPHPRLLAAAITIIKQEKPMQIVHRFLARPIITLAGEHAIRLRVATNRDDLALGLSITQAEQLRRDLAAALARLRREASPYPSHPSGPSGSS